MKRSRLRVLLLAILVALVCAGAPPVTLRATAPAAQKSKSGGNGKTLHAKDYKKKDGKKDGWAKASKTPKTPKAAKTTHAQTPVAVADGWRCQSERQARARRLRPISRLERVHHLDVRAVHVPWTPRT
jgi:hypothetical protein